MQGSLNRLIEEAIQLELQMADLYMLFYRLFPMDSEFWWRLALEEKNHASVLKTAIQMKNSGVDIPEDLLPQRIEMLEKSIGRIRDFSESIRNTPDRTRAFQFAYSLENSAGELHYDAFMKSSNESHLSKIFRSLNANDLDHADRIRQYMFVQQIPAGK